MSFCRLAATSDLQGIQDRHFHGCSDGREIALIDVRRAGQYGKRHLFFAVPLPYSRFELGLPELVPNRSARLVLCDDADGVAFAPAPRHARSSATNVHVLKGGAPAGRRPDTRHMTASTYRQNVRRAHRACAPHAADTAQDLQAKRERATTSSSSTEAHGAEYHKMNIPGIPLSGQRARAAHPRHRPRSDDQDRGQLRRADPFDHRRPDPDRLRRPQSCLRAGERDTGLVSRRPPARTRHPTGVMPMPVPRVPRPHSSRPGRSVSRWHAGQRPSDARGPGLGSPMPRTTYLLDIRTAEGCHRRARRLRPRAGRPAHPGDRTTGRRAGRRTHRARRPRNGARPGDRRLASADPAARPNMRRPRHRGLGRALHRGGGDAGAEA